MSFGIYKFCFGILIACNYHICYTEIRKDDKNEKMY